MFRNKKERKGKRFYCSPEFYNLDIVSRQSRDCEKCFK